MRHNKKGRKLGTDYSHTKAMKRSLVSALFLNDRIKTVESRAKEIRPQVDKGDHLGQARRSALPPSGHRLPERQGARPRDLREGRPGHVQDRPGGYTRIMKLRPGKVQCPHGHHGARDRAPCGAPKAERKASGREEGCCQEGCPERRSPRRPTSPRSSGRGSGLQADGTVEQIEAVDAAEARCRERRRDDRCREG